MSNTIYLTRKKNEEKTCFKSYSIHEKLIIITRKKSNKSDKISKYLEFKETENYDPNYLVSDFPDFIDEI